MKWTTLAKLLALPSISLIALSSSCQHSQTQNNNPIHKNLYAKAFSTEAKVFIDNYTKMQKEIVDYILQQSQVNLALREQIKSYRLEKPSSFNKYFLPFAQQQVQNDNIFAAKYKEFQAIFQQANITSFILAQAMKNFVDETINECNEMLVTLNQYFDINQNFSYNLQEEFANVQAIYQIYYLNSIYSHILTNITTLQANKSIDQAKITSFEQTIKNNLKQIKSLYQTKNNSISINASYNVGIKLSFSNLDQIIATYKKEFGSLYLQSLDLNKNNTFTSSISSMNNQMKILISKEGDNLVTDYLFIDPHAFVVAASQLGNDAYISEMNSLRRENYHIISNYIIDDLVYDKKLHLKSNLHNDVQFDLSLASKKQGSFNTLANVSSPNFGTKLSQDKELANTDYLMRLQVNQNQLKSLGIPLISILQNPVFNTQGNVILAQPESLAATLNFEGEKLQISLAYKDENYIVPAGWDTVLYPNKKIALAYNFPKNVKLSIFNIYLKLDQATYNKLNQMQDNDTFDLKFI
ncbi:hypothetical protein ACNQ1M_00095 [Mycoplasma sp. VS424B]|uniref:hypothetical protein n=1 Tax=Mycoplasma sp. VS424B TaxID=3401660 RepID=UPI003AB015E3